MGLGAHNGSILEIIGYPLLLIWVNYSIRLDGFGDFLDFHISFEQNDFTSEVDPVAYPSK